MGDINRPIQITSIVLIIIGALLLVLTIYSGGSYNFALPLLFLVLGGIFILLALRLHNYLMYAWAPYLYIPACLFVAFGIIFLLNVITQDWNSWAYAWLLLIAGMGFGSLMTSREVTMHPTVHIVSWCMAVLGMTFFVVFGAVAGGRFIQIMAPILLVVAGLSLRSLRLENFLPASFLEKLRHFRPLSVINPSPHVAALVEPLSSRELEVLKLIDIGLTNQQIADKLTVAPSTIKTHINNIYGKLGVQTRVQALNRARELNLFDL